MISNLFYQNKKDFLTQFNKRMFLDHVLEHYLIPQILNLCMIEESPFGFILM